MGLEIDGGWGEGGGQIVRTAVSLACAQGKGIVVNNIRKGRKQPGLRPQHLAGINLAAEMCDADVKGLEVGSTNIEFRPGNNIGGRFETDIGTAGSISLVLQACLIPALFAKGQTSLHIRGGTDVPLSPPTDFLSMVILPLLRKMNANIEMTIDQRGFYPSGGGVVNVDISPVGELKGIDISETGRFQSIIGNIASRNLPDHVPDRIQNAIVKYLSEYPIPKISKDSSKGPSTGVSLTLAAIYENTILGSSALGEKGLPAERLGEIASQGLKETMTTGATLDDHTGDQLIPFMFLANGPSTFKTPELSMHARTNLWVVQQFMERKVDVQEAGRTTIVTIE